MSPNNLRRIVVGTMCHCDDPADCYDHWELFADPVGFDEETGHMRQGGRPTEAELRSLVAGRDALRYMTQPTMGFPGSQGGPWEDITPPTMPDPEWWVRNGYGADDNIRLALATCIGMAKRALEDPTSGGNGGQAT